MLNCARQRIQDHQKWMSSTEIAKILGESGANNVDPPEKSFYILIINTNGYNL